MNNFFKLRHILLVLYFLPVFFIVFVVGNAYRFSHRFAEARFINFLPFKEKIDFFQHPEQWGGNNMFFMLKEIFGNALLLFPLPVIMILFYKVKNGFTAVVYSLLLSCLIETIQAITDMGKADIDDVLLNTFGATIGVLFTRLVQRQKWWLSLQLTLHLS